jgi:hypothetical protein
VLRGPSGAHEQSERDPIASADTAFEAVDLFKKARRNNQADVHDLRLDAIRVATANLIDQRRMERIATEAAKRNGSEVSTPQARMLYDAVSSAYGLLQQATETALGLALTAEDDVLEMVGRPTAQSDIATTEPDFATLEADIAALDRNVDAWTTALQRANVALKRQANETNYVDVEICKDGLARANIYREALVPKNS